MTITETSASGFGDELRHTPTMLKSSRGTTGSQWSYRACLLETSAIDTADDHDRLTGKESVKASIGRGVFTRSTLDRMCDIIDGVDLTDAIDAVVCLNGLAANLHGLWIEAQNVSPLHQDILAFLDIAIVGSLRVGGVSVSQLRAMREAIIDLGSPVLTAAHVESVASQMTDEGFSVMEPFLPDEAGNE
jgi:hypothetical protein